MQLSKDQLSSLHTAILSWYAINGRHSLPWRDKTMQNRAYRVLISEVMLQQTQVKVVLENYYFPFLEKFPTLKALSVATQEEVLRTWQGLGYYSRARNLHKLAQFCTQANIDLPKDRETLRTLPGIGEYTAGAIACFGYDAKVSFVDSNIKRILMRLFALSKPTQTILAQKAQEILNTQDTFNHNQALLDLGALICLPKNPKCAICPIHFLCKGKEKWECFSPKKTTRTIKKSLFLAIWIQDSKIALYQSKEKLYYGMYSFPSLYPPHNPTKSKDNLNLKKLGILKHSYTKFNLEVHLFLSHHFNPKEVEFFPRNSLSSIPLSALSLKILNFLERKKIF